MYLSLLVTALIMSASTTTTAKDLPISGGRLRGTTKEYQATSNLKDSGYDSKLLAVAEVRINILISLTLILCANSFSYVFLIIYNNNRITTDHVTRPPRTMTRTGLPRTFPSYSPGGARISVTVTAIIIVARAITVLNLTAALIRHTKHIKGVNVTVTQSAPQGSIARSSSATLVTEYHMAVVRRRPRSIVAYVSKKVQ